MRIAAPAGAGADAGKGGIRQFGWWVLNFAVCIGFLWLDRPAAKERGALEALLGLDQELEGADAGRAFSGKAKSTCRTLPRPERVLPKRRPNPTS